MCILGFMLGCPRFQLHRSLHCSVFKFQTLETYHLIGYIIECEWVHWLPHYEDTLFLNFCFVGYRILVQISDTIKSLCSTFLCFNCCITSSDWVTELTAESHVKSRLYLCDTSGLYRSFRCTYILHRHLLFCTKIWAVNKMFQTSLLCIVFNSGCLNLLCVWFCVCVCVSLFVCLYVHVCVCMQVCTYW
jgi:hypothetical protein